MQNIKVKCCPIEKTLSLIGKKWSINIIRDMFAGKKRFSDFLKANPELSTKILSARLKELQDHCIVEKQIVNKSPVVIEYTLTEKGKKLNKIIYELSMFSIEQHKDEIFDKKTTNPKQFTKMMESSLGVN